MAKVTLNKLGLKFTPKVETLKINDQEIEVTTVIPIDDVIGIVEKVVNRSLDNQNVVNTCKIHVLTNIEIILAYTNIKLTDKQYEDAPKTYDLLDSQKIFTKVINMIDPDQYQFILENIKLLIDSIHSQRNSISGIMDMIKDDYSDLEFDATQLNKEISNPENLTLLKQVMSSLG